MKNKTALVLWASIFLSHFALADIAVIVHPDNSINNVAQKDLMRLYLGKRSQLQGVEVTPADQASDMPIKKEFYQKVINKSLFQAKAYWSRMIFTGKGAPPTEFSSSSEIKQWVSQTLDGVGYIYSSEVDDSVKVVLLVK